MDKIFTASDRAREMGFNSFLEYLENILQKQISLEVSGQPVNALVDFGRWLAKCECGGASYVEPDEGFFCTRCMNTDNGGKPRPVVFPENKKEIEAELLKRDAKYIPGMFGTQAAANASGLPRSWNGETIAELQAQREAYSEISKDDIMTEYMKTQARLQELERIMNKSEGA